MLIQSSNLQMLSLLHSFKCRSIFSAEHLVTKNKFMFIKQVLDAQLIL